MIDSLIRVLESFRSSLPKVEEAGKSLADCLRNGGSLLGCGNGGSASDAMHFCEELTGRFRENRPPLSALCLNSDGTALTCIANDFGFEEVFARQTHALGREGDALIGFSTSGNSENVVRAFRAAREKKMTTVLLGGADGGEAAADADHTVLVPARSSARIQEVHTWVLHRWVEIIEFELFGIERG